MPLILFAWPDEEAEENRYAIEIPALGNWILTHEMGGVVPGLKDWPHDERPPVAPVFFAFRIMVGIGVVFLLLVGTALVLRARRRLFVSRWFLKTMIAAGPMGFIAVLAGWITTEIGRQPWTVYGHLRTADSVTPALSGSDILISLLGYMIAYLILFPAGFYFIARAIAAGPEAPRVEAGKPADLVEAGGRA